MFLERAQPAPQVHELPVESRQLSGALRFGSLGGHVGRSADLVLGSKDSESLVPLDTEGYQVEFNPRRTCGAEEY